MEHRTHTCGELDKKHIQEEVTLCGWVTKRRDHGGLIFIDLRDRYGITQVVFDPTLLGGESVHELAGKLRNEYVIWCHGKVRSRPEGMANEKLKTGAIEVACTKLDILSEAKTLPFLLEGDSQVAETVRLKYRYLDLRRKALQKNLITRHKVILEVRNFLDSHNFVEVETPILYKSTPEGARDFIVPSRLNQGTFYALPQSPQTLKQLLMIGGMDRYFQIARCFRDEDLRADRQPEFTQIDIETSFLSEEGLFAICENMMSKLWKVILNQDVKIPFQRMSYKESMSRFGCDKPDLRFGLEIQDISQVFANSSFQVFQSALTPTVRGKKGSICGILVPGQAEKFSRKDLDDLQSQISVFGAKGLLWVKVQDGLVLKSPAEKFFSDSEKQGLITNLNLKPNDLFLMIADQKDHVVLESLGALRLILGARLGLIPAHGQGKSEFLWITRFPLFEYDEKEGRYFAKHHPFTSPVPEHFEDFMAAKNLENMDANAYDLVLNGVELGSGSLRIYRSDIQAAMFKNLGISQEEAKLKFGFFLEALQYGTPPHGGIAFGIERLVAILCGVGPIRDVMAFPKTQKGHCLMSESPSTVLPEQLSELGLNIKIK
ncbi:MAG: aspartate--tRNA ligase [Bdellovibrio sp.]|nr:aspartate--tRNA ligase [Bdellovibrio sp.]